MFDHPSESIGCMTAAAMIVTAINGIYNSHLRVRIQNYGPLTPFKDIKANLVGKLVAVKGTIIRVGGIRSMVMKMTFECDICGSTTQIVLFILDFSYRALLMESIKYHLVVGIKAVEVAHFDP